MSLRISKVTQQITKCSNSFCTVHQLRRNTFENACFPDTISFSALAESPRCWKVKTHHRDHDAKKKRTVYHLMNCSVLVADVYKHLPSLETGIKIYHLAHSMSTRNTATSNIANPRGHLWTLSKGNLTKKFSATSRLPELRMLMTKLVTIDSHLSVITLF